MQRVTLRSATTGYRRVVLRFLRSMLEDMASLGGRAPADDAEALEARILEVLDRADHRFVLACMGDEPVGLAEAGLRDLPAVFRPRRILHVHSVFVVPAFRRRGIASDLLEAVLAWGRSRGCQEAELHTLAGHPARGLYERAGFRPFETEMTREL